MEITDWYKNNRRAPVDGYDDPKIKNLVEGEGSDRNERRAIIGGSVGGVILVTIVACLSLLFIRWRRRKRLTATINPAEAGGGSAEQPPPEMPAQLGPAELYGSVLNRSD
jgi:hypothetical protein